MLREVETRAKLYPLRKEVNHVKKRGKLVCARCKLER